MQLLLLQSLNKKETLKNAKVILSSCRSYRNVLGDAFSFKIMPDYTFDVVLNEVDETPIAIEAGVVLRSVFIAINKICDASNRRLVYEKYLAKYKEKDIYIARNLNFSETDFYRMLDLALLEFSEIFNYGELLVFE